MLLLRCPPKIPKFHHAATDLQIFPPVLGISWAILPTNPALPNLKDPTLRLQCRSPSRQQQTENEMLKKTEHQVSRNWAVTPIAQPIRYAKTTASGQLAQLPWIHMVSDIMNLHDSIEILTLSQHHETHDNLETQSQKYVTIVQDHRPTNRTSHLHSCTTCPNVTSWSHSAALPPVPQETTVNSTQTKYHHRKEKVPKNNKTRQPHNPRVLSDPPFRPCVSTRFPVALQAHFQACFCQESFMLASRQTFTALGTRRVGTTALSRKT